MRQNRKGRSRKHSEGGRAVELDCHDASLASGGAQQYLIYDQQLRALMMNSTANGGFDAASTIGGDESLAGMDVQSLGISFDGESILMPTTHGGEPVPLTAIPGRADCSSIHGDFEESNIIFGDEEEPPPPSSSLAHDRVYAAIVDEDGRITLKEVTAPMKLVSSLPPSASQKRQESLTTTLPTHDLNPSDPPNLLDRSSRSRRCCCPTWITDAPFSLKVYILGALVLFLGSMSLTVYTIYELGKNESSNSSSPTVVGDNFNDKGYNRPPTQVDVPPPSPTKASSPTASPTPLPVMVEPVVRSPFVPMDTTVYDTTALSFYLVAGALSNGDLARLTDLPTTQSSSATISPSVLEAFPFLVNLGSWSAESSLTESLSCPSSMYESVATQYQSSSVPVMFVMGDDEVTNCPGPDLALEQWRQTLGNSVQQHNSFDNSDWQWWTKPDRPEKFSFVFGSVLFVGLYLPQEPLLNSAGTPSTSAYNTYDWNLEYASDNLDWVKVNFEYASESTRVMVLFTSNPVDSNSMFNLALTEQIITNYEMVRIISINASGNGTASLNSQFQGVGNWDVINVPSSAWPPTKVDVVVQEPQLPNERAIVSVTVDQDQWLV